MQLAGCFRIASCEKGNIKAARYQPFGQMGDDTFPWTIVSWRCAPGNWRKHRNVHSYTVFLSRKRWLLRPGELVHADFSGGKVAKGFYVPANAIMQDGGGPYVYVVSEGEPGKEYAKRVHIAVEASVSNFRRIEPVKGGELKEGKKVIIDGVHYLHDGELINAYNEVEVSP